MPHQWQVLSGQVPPIPARYSPELRALVGQMLQQSPMARPTIDDVLLSAPVSFAMTAPCWPAVDGSIAVCLACMVCTACQETSAHSGIPSPTLLLPQAQRHLALLPPELRQRCISPALSGEHSLARLIQPIKAGGGGSKEVV